MEPRDVAKLANLPKQEMRWLLRAQAGDREALDALLRLVQEPLYRYILSLVGSRALAEDILQEVFLLIYRKLPWLRDPELFRPWAYRIASREAFKHLKRERRWVEQNVDETVLADWPVLPRDALTAEMLERQVAQIAPASRAVIVLHYLHDLPLGEIADVLGIALGTVKSRLAYGLASLRKQLTTKPSS